MIDRTNKHWDKNITDEEIFNKEFSIGYLIQSNQHLEVFRIMKDVVLCTYIIIAEFKHLGYNGQSLYCNGQRLAYRKSKQSAIIFGKDVVVLENNLRPAGSNKYPSIGSTGASVTLQFLSYGLPFIDKVNGWSIKIVGMKMKTD